MTSSISSSYNSFDSNTRTQEALTQALIIANDKQSLKLRMSQDANFKTAVYCAIANPPPHEIKSSLAGKVIEILTPEEYPDWVREIKLLSSNETLKVHDIEQTFLKQCAMGDQLDLETVKANKLDLTQIRDHYGHNGLHLLLLNPSATPQNLADLFAACPQLLFIKDFDQNLPLDFIDHQHPFFSQISVLYFLYCFEIGAKTPPCNDLILYFLRLKDTGKIIAMTLKALDLYPIESIAELSSLERTMTACCTLHNSKFALNFIACIASHYQLPVFALIALLAPQHMPEALGEQHLTNLMSAPLDCKSKLWTSFGVHKLMGQLPPADNALSANLRAILFLLGTNPSLETKFREYIYFFLSNVNFSQAVALQMSALPAQHPAAHRFLLETILQYCQEKKLYSDIFIGVSELIKNGLYQNSTVSNFFNDLILECIDKIERGLFPVAITNLDFVAPHAFEQVVEKAAKTLNPVELSSTLYVFVSHLLNKQQLDDNSLENLKTLLKFPQLCLSLESVFDSLITKPSQDRDQILNIFLTHFSWTSVAAHIILKRILMHIDDRYDAIVDESNDNDFKITEIEEKILIEMIKKGANFREGDTLWLARYLSGEGFKELIQTIGKNLTKEDLKRLANYCLPDNNTSFGVILEEICKRKDADQIIRELCENTLHVSRQYSLNPVKVILRMFNLLLNNSSETLRNKIIGCLNSIIERDKYVIRNPLIELQQLKILAKAGVDLRPLFDEDHLYLLLRSGRDDTFAQFLFQDVFKCLSLDKDDRNPFNRTSKAGKFFAANAEVVKSKSSDGNTFQNMNGYTYTITISTDHTIYIHRHKLGSIRVEDIFQGYITYEKMVEFIAKDSLSRRNSNLVEVLKAKYSTMIVSQDATVEVHTLIETNKKAAIKINSDEQKIQVYLLKPGHMEIQILEFTFEQYYQNHHVIEDIFKAWEGQVKEQHQFLQQRFGERCFYTSNVPNQLDLYGIALDPKTGQAALVEASVNGPYQVKWLHREELILRCEEWQNDLNHIADLHQWAAANQGVNIRGRASILSEYSSLLRPLMNNNLWVCLPCVHQRAWLVARELISTGKLMVAVFNSSERQKKLDGILEIQKGLGGYTNANNLNRLVGPSQVKKHTKPAPVNLNVLLTHFNKLKNEPWFLNKAAKEKKPMETLESDLNHFITCASSQSGIVGWEDANKHRKDYEDLLIYITNTLDAFLNDQEDQALPLEKQNMTSLVFELAVHGRYCGTKLSDICYGHYALAFKIENMESAADNLDETLRLAYQQSFLEALDTLIQFLGDPEAQSQSIHVMSYLRAALAALGLRVPYDPRIPPNMQNGSDDDHHQMWGQRDYPPETLQSILPSILLPLFILKFQEAQNEMKNKGQWDAIGQLKRILFDRIAMGLEETIHFPLEPYVIEQYRTAEAARKQSIENARKAVKETVNEIDALQNSLPFGIDLVQLEYSIIDLTTKINESSEKHLALTRRVEQLRTRLKQIDGTYPPQAAGVVVENRKRLRGPTDIGFESNDDELQSQIFQMQKQQTFADQMIEKLKVQRDTAQRILANATRDNDSLSRLESLRRELAIRQSELERIVQNKCETLRMVEEIAERDGYLTTGDDDCVLLSLKGLMQVLIQKNLFMPDQNLLDQWKAMKEHKEPAAENRNLTTIV